MTSLTIVFLGLFAACMAYAFAHLRPIFRKRGQLNAELTGRLSESLGGIRVVKAYTAEKREDIIFAEGVHRLFRNIASSITGVSAMTAVTTAIVGIIGVVVMVVGGRAVLAGTMTEGDLFMYVIFVGLVTMPLVQMASIGTQISEAFAGLDRIREIRNTPTEAEGDADRQPIERPHGDIRFEQVYFEYVEGVPVLKDISFEAKAGTTTALVGSSGSGKSTLIGLIMAFHRPKSGTVRIDGMDFEEIRLRDYRAHLGVVLQDNFLFAGTIAENIAYARPHASRADIERVGRIAHCAEFVERFEDGYDTVVGERGVKLSGGQRQRVAIARAILAEPRILILDEATSSLDSESEEHIQDGIKALRAGRTTFVIAHRLSTIRSADQILVLEGGEIVERGSHRELMALNGRYRELYEKQHKFEENLFVNPGEELNT
jgi:subfamily B ATP-binding cassette protein MsbA